MAYSTSKKVQEAGMILGGLGVLGFIGIVWLMIYGNLSGNLGFTQLSTDFTNQTINLTDSGNTPSSAQNRVDGSLTNVVITNATGGEIVASGNYTITGVLIQSATATYNNTNVNVSATVSYDGTSEIQTENVITNVTGGFQTFFGFSNVLFTIAAIVLLIFMLVGLLALVMSIVKMQQEKRTSGFR